MPRPVRPIDIDELIASSGAAKLAELADEQLLARVAALLDVVNASPQLEASRDAAVEQIAGVLGRRLRMEADRRDHPEIADEEIVRPVFVVGFPRTGTTLLHTLLATEPGALAPRLWEVRNPSPPPGLTGPDPDRLALGDADAKAWCDLVPGMLAAHPYFDLGAQTPVEDEELLTLDFQNTYPTWYPSVPVLLLGTASSDPVTGYRFHRRFLQHLQWRRQPTRWTLKGVAHQFALPALWSVYPDALCIWPHRDPAECLGSLFELQAIVNEAILGGPIDRPAMARAVAAAVRGGLDSVLSSPAMSDERLVHVRYPDLVADPVATIRTIYGGWGIDVSDEFEAAIRAWLADPGHRSDRHGRFTYSLADYGFTQDELTATFADYKERFDL